MGQTATKTTVSGTTGQTDIHVRVDAQVKAETERILGKIGISMSDLINMTLRRVIAERRIPFDTRVEEAPVDLIVETKEDIERKIEEAFENYEKNPVLYTEAEVRAHLGI